MLSSSCLANCWRPRVSKIADRELRSQAAVQQCNRLTAGQRHPDYLGIQPESDPLMGLSAADWNESD